MTRVKLPKYEAVIFDLDGTLVRLPVDWEGVKRDLRKLLLIDGDFSPLFETIDGWIAEKPESRSRIFSLLDRYEEAAAKRSTLLVGVREVFVYLTERTKLALVTMQGSRACSHLLEKHRLARFFEFSLTREDALQRSVQLEIAMKRLSTGARATLFVGDRLNDVAAARGVGAAVALVGRRGMADPAPDLQVDTMVALLRYFSGDPR